MWPRHHYFVKAPQVILIYSWGVRTATLLGEKIGSNRKRGVKDIGKQAQKNYYRVGPFSHFVSISLSWEFVFVGVVWMDRCCGQMILPPAPERTGSTNRCGHGQGQWEPTGVRKVQGN